MDLKNNLECLEQLSKNFLQNKLEISNKQEWQFDFKLLKKRSELIDYLYHHKLILLEDTKSIDPAILIFPVTLEHFLRIISQSFSDEKIRAFESSIVKFMEQLNDTKSTIQFWNTQGMSNQELKCLLIVFEKIKKEVKTIIDDFDEFNQSIQSNRENVQQMKDQFQHLNNEIITSYDYQKNEGFIIEKEFLNTRVRDVQYRNQPIKVLKTYANGITRQIGYCTDNDFALEIMKIPKNFSDLEFNERLLYSFDALKELIFSKYYQKYLGCNQVQDQYYNLYFLELIKGKSLKIYLENATCKMHPNMSLFRLWMREIFLCFKDLLEKTIYMPILPISLKNIYISENGLKINIKNIWFSGIRREENQSHEALEARLLKEYAILLLQILGLDEQDINYLEKYLDFQHFIISLLDSEEDLENYKKGLTKKRFTFQEMLEHQILNENYLIEADVVDMVDDFEKIFGV